MCKGGAKISTNENKSGRPKKEVNPFNDIFRKLIGSATQQEVANKIGVSRQNVGRWLLGDTTPDINTLSKIADAYKVSTDYLLGRTPNKTTDADVKSVCEYTGLSEKAVEMIYGISKSYDFRYSNALNLILSSPQFALWVYGVREWLNNLELLEEAIYNFKQKIREYGEEPPNDIMNYAAKISLGDFHSCVGSEAYNVIEYQDSLNYREYRLQNQLKNLLDSLKKESD